MKHSEIYIFSKIRTYNSTKRLKFSFFVSLFSMQFITGVGISVSLATWPHYNGGRIKKSMTIIKKNDNRLGMPKCSIARVFKVKRAHFFVSVNNF